jgi:hypothetical protein
MFVVMVSAPRRSYGCVHAIANKVNVDVVELPLR